MSRDFHRETIKERTALTFLEIMIVIVLISLLFFLAMPRFKGVYIKNQLQTATGDLASLMRLARSEAVYSGKPVAIELDLEKDRYWLNLPPLPQDEEARYRRSDKRKLEWEEQRYFPVEVSFIAVSTDALSPEKDKGIARVIFFPDGSATAATVVLGNTAGSKMTIDVPPATGFVRAYFGEPVEQKEQ